MADDILIVDDERDIRSLLSITLEDGAIQLCRRQMLLTREPCFWPNHQNWPFLIFGCELGYGWHRNA